LGELLPGGTIKHALKVNIYCTDYCNAATRTAAEPTPIDGPGYRWPAVNRDAGGTYGGSVDGLQMGSLIALPCDPDASNVCQITWANITAPSSRVPSGCSTSAGLTTDVAKKLFKAFQDWGGYVADTGVLPTLDVEAGVPEELLATSTPIDLWASYTDTGATHDFYCDWWRIWVNVELVTNNDSTHVGGSAAVSGTSGAESRFHANVKRPAPLGN
jgi:hypothetical protein